MAHVLAVTCGPHSGRLGHAWEASAMPPRISGSTPGYPGQHQDIRVNKGGLMRRVKPHRKTHRTIPSHRPTDNATHLTRALATKLPVSTGAWAGIGPDRKGYPPMPASPGPFHGLTAGGTEGGAKGLLQYASYETPSPRARPLARERRPRGTHPIAREDGHK